MNLVPQPHGGAIVNARKGETANPNGRPRKIYTILKQSGYTKDDIRDAFHEVSWNDVNELQRLFKDDKTPAIIKVVCHAFKRAIEKGDYRYVQEIIEQVIGKAKESIDARVLVAKFDVKFNDEPKTDDRDNL